MYQVSSKILLLVLLLSLANCSKTNNDKFIFYTNKDKIVIDNFKIEEDKLNNLYLVVNDVNERKKILNTKIDSLLYENDNKIHKASMNKISGKISNDFHFVLYNDGSKVFVFGHNEDNEEMFSIGVKDNLEFINKKRIIYFKSLK